jgi:hypothetical protein
MNSREWKELSKVEAHHQFIIHGFNYSGNNKRQRAKEREVRKRSGRYEGIVKRKKEKIKKNSANYIFVL